MGELGLLLLLFLGGGNEPRLQRLTMTVNKEATGLRVIDALGTMGEVLQLINWDGKSLNVVWRPSSQTAENFDWDLSHAATWSGVTNVKRTFVKPKAKV